jgi:putative transposase
MSKSTARKKIRLSPRAYRQGHAFFLTISTHRHYTWFSLHRHLAESGVEILRHISRVRETNLYAWCFMPDHVHLLVADTDVVEFVRLFKGRMTPMASSLERGRRLWQRSFYDHALRGDESIRDVAIYIWRNPVRAEIVTSPVEYDWSGSLEWPNWREFFG